MRKLTLFLCSVFVFALSTQANPNSDGSISEIEAYMVSLDHGCANPLEEVSLESPSGKVSWDAYFFIQSEHVFQTIEGIGGAFNEIGGEALAALDSMARQEVLEHLFGLKQAGFSFCRTAIGSSDFGIDAYSYSEVPEDYGMEHFTIERDQRFVLPYIKGAFEQNPQLTLFASPWSPPGWMKQSGSMTGLKDAPNRLRPEAKVYAAYAKYFVKYIQAYAENGVNIDRICVQNENDANTKYPSCTFPAAEMIRFTNQYLASEFEKNGLETKIYAGTYRVVEKMDLIDFVTAQNTDIFDGVGIQYTKPGIIADAYSINPSLNAFHTEGACFNGQNSAAQANTRLEEVASYLNSGLTAFTYWNMILNETTNSGWDWAQNSLINIDREAKTVRYNPDYNAMMIISHFIRPGDVRVASFARGGKHPIIAVKSPEGILKILVQNTSGETKPFEVVIDGESHTWNLPANAITALRVGN